MALTAEELKEISTTLGEQAKNETAKAVKAAEEAINAKYQDVHKGLMPRADFEAFKSDALQPINDTLARLEEAQKEQGRTIKLQSERAEPNSKTLNEFLAEKKDQIEELKAKGSGMLEISGSELKAAGITSITGSIQDMTAPPTSPYAPGISGEPISIFDIARNPNYITNRVDLGRTNQSRLAWANEIGYEGSPAVVAEGALKPLTQHRFQVETSVAKKVAGYVQITDEFEQDLPQFATAVRRMLQQDVLRAWDDAIQVDVQTAARPFEITQLNGSIQDANYWDALLAMMGQVGFNNFTPNAAAINWLTNVKMKTLKNSNGTYLLPPFVEEIQRMLIYANKVAVDYALVGDMSQYHVDVYKDFYLKIGWVNDDLIRNQFSIVGEIRYHSYISEARKKALVYDNLATVAGLINA